MTPSTQVPPQNVEAEEHVLGALMVAAPTLERVIGEVRLQAGDFYMDKHRLIFAAIRELYMGDQPVDQLAVCDALGENDKLEEAGGKHFVYSLTDRVPAAANAKHYAEIVRRHSLSRKRIDIGYKLADPALNGEAPQLLSELADLIADPLAEGGPATPDRFADGAAFILDAPEKIEAVWGSGAEVLHPVGEPLMIAAPPGAGKTTLAQQYALALAGIGPGELLGLPVYPPDGKVVYIAADRPSQAARSFRRMVTERDRDLLAEHLEVWRGPLPFDPAAEPHLLTPFLKARGAGAVVIDSLGATARELASDEAGSRLFAAMGEVTAEGIEVVVLHHDRKREQGSDKVRALDDVYGSRWITASAGSVLYLDGQAGDLVLTARHLKQPAEEIGPLEIRHDHGAGRTVIHEKPDLLDAAVNGITVKEAAGILLDCFDPDDNEIEKARRRLAKLVDSGRLEKLPPEPGQPAVYKTVVIF